MFYLKQFWGYFLMFNFKAFLGLIFLALAGYMHCELDLSSLAKIDQLFVVPQRLDQLTFTSDNHFDASEFNYLVDLPLQSWVTSAQVKNACFYLAQTKQFRKLDLVVKATSHQGCALHFQLAAHPRLAKVEIAGVVSGRDWYRRLYGLQYGAKFTLAQHRHALYKLRRELKATGYLDALITDRVVVDPLTKLVTVKLKILPGSSYRIGRVRWQVSPGEELDLKLVHILKQALLKHRYSEAFLNQKVTQFKRELDLQGYPFAQIQLDLLKSPGGARIDLGFLIKLGQKYQYQFTGNCQYSSGQLLDCLRKQGRQHWYLPAEFIEQDLQDFYRQRGFDQIQVSGQPVVEGCRISIIEGPRVSIKKINLLGVNRFSSSWLKLRFFKKLLFQKYYDQQVLNSTLLNLQRWYNRAGFWDFRIERTRLVPVPSGGASDYVLELEIHEGQAASSDIATPSTRSMEPARIFGKTVRQGNGQFKFSQLYRVLPYQAGDDWSKADLQTATCRLKNLDVFDQVRLLPARELDFLSQRPVIMHLNQSYDFEMRTRLGFQKVSKNLIFKSGATYRAGTSLVYKNLWQLGHQVRLDFDFTRFYRSTSAVYQLPVDWHWPLILATKAYDNKYEQPLAAGSKQMLYNAYQQGGIASLSYRDDALDAALNLGVEGVKIDNLSTEYAQAIDFSSNLVNRRVPFFLLEPTCLLDRLDDSLNPRRGTFSLISLKTMISLAKANNYFCKFLLEQSFFYPVFEQSTVAARVRLGHIFTNDFSAVMPIERFYLGGANSLRSFEVDFAPPGGLIRAKDGEELFVPQGGKSMLNFNLELRIPIYHSLGVVLFQDLGTLFKRQMSAGGELLTATGIGLRYQTPVGPLRFDIGWRPRRFSGDSNFAWFLTIGQAF